MKIGSFKTIEKLDKISLSEDFRNIYYKHKMAEYSVSSPMYSVEGEAIDIEQDKDLQDIQDALEAA
jgi:hypothetical protein